MTRAHYLLMAGGTGGHVFPALAVAKELLRRGAEVSWLGTSTHIESKVVAGENIPFYAISVKGVRGKHWLSKLSAPFMLVAAVFQAVNILLKVKPSVVIGFGGFVSAPGALAAKLLNRKLIIHEQNAVAGTTNRLLARLATKKLVGFDGSLPGALYVGNPVRNEIVALSQSNSKIRAVKKDTEEPVKLLIIGGSLGAQALNKVVPAGLALLPELLRPQVWHQTGKDKQIGLDKYYSNNHISARVTEFIDDMATAYDWADLVICRAGALTVSEISVAGLPALFIPFPYAVDDHQSQNARWLVARGAALEEQQMTLTAERLATVLQSLLQDKQRLIDMAEAAKALSLPEATVRVADICEEVASAS